MNGVGYVAITTLTALGWLLTWTFVILYARRSPWDSTPIGRLLMSDGVVVGMLLSLSVWGMFIGPAWWPLYLPALAAMDALAAWRIRLVLRAQRRS